MINCSGMCQTKKAEDDNTAPPYIRQSEKLANAAYLSISLLCNKYYSRSEKGVKASIEALAKLGLNLRVRDRIVKVVQQSFSIHI